MNILQQLIGVAFNILQLPFGTVNNYNNSVNLGENSVYYDTTAGGGNNVAAALSALPFNLLRSGGVNPCKTINFKLGDNDLKVSIQPRGICANCCTVKVDRDIKFHLFNNKNEPHFSNIIEPYNVPGAALRAGLNPNWKTVIFIHGFTEPSPGESGLAIVDAYMARPESYNVILMDWSEMGPFPWYRQAVQNGKLIGKLLKDFIEVFHDSGEIPIWNLHIVGFSLGGHIASHAGKQLRRGLKIPRITALDPAFPDFPVRDTSRRLTRSDAEYIDVIHTDSGIFGFPTSLGHADFYPNGGRALQPGCQPSYLVNQRLIDQVLACSHVRAWRLYAESVRNLDAFPATRCRSWRGRNKLCNFTVDAFMGYPTKNVTGQFYLLTKFRPPFSKTVKEQMIV